MSDWFAWKQTALVANITFSLLCSSVCHVEVSIQGAMFELDMNGDALR